MVKELVTNCMSLFPNEYTLTKEIESWRSFVDNVSSEEEDRDLF